MKSKKIIASKGFIEKIKKAIEEKKVRHAKLRELIKKDSPFV
jgi:hypothetical protein